MSDTNTPIQIPSELNVPEPKNDNGKILPIKTPQSADDVQLPKKPHLALDAKSRSMFNFPTTSRTNDEHTESKEEPNEERIPEITMSPPSTATFHYNSARKSTASLNHIDNLTGEQQSVMRQISTSANDMKLSPNRKRVNSITEDRDDGEFDELQAASSGNSKLRIRASIVSMFGRMGKLRRPSIASQQSANGGAEAKARGPPIRALPTIAATKILRAFSYVGKLNVKRLFSRKKNVKVIFGSAFSEIVIFPYQRQKQLSSYFNILFVDCFLFSFSVHERRIQANNPQYNSQFKYAVSKSIESIKVRFF